MTHPSSTTPNTSSYLAVQLPKHDVLSAHQLRQRWLSNRESPDHELAVLDVREAHSFAQAHIPLSYHLPLSTLQWRAPSLLPRLAVPIVLCADDVPMHHDSANTGSHPVLARAIFILSRLGYTQIAILAGGVQAWPSIGGTLVSGYNTLVKAFADAVRVQYQVPSIRVEDLRHRLQTTPNRVTVVDVRTPADYAFSTIAGSRNYPGTEWVLRDLTAFTDQKPPSEHLWAVHCFSRTRGVIGTASLRVLHGNTYQTAWVDDGVMQWALQDYPTQAQQPTPDDIPPLAAKAASQLARSIQKQYSLPAVTAATVTAWQQDNARTLYQFDLRPQAVQGNESESAQAARQEAQPIAGGQLLMNYENHVPVRGARVVLLDDAHQLRATITAFWLTQLAQCDVFILNADADADAADLHNPQSIATTAKANTAIKRTEPQRASAQTTGILPDLGSNTQWISATQLHAAQRKQRVTVLDVGPSAEYSKAHIQGAAFAVITDLTVLYHAWQCAHRQGKRLVLTSSDGMQAALLAHEMQDALESGWEPVPSPDEPDTLSAQPNHSCLPLQVLRGGTKAWQQAALPMQSDWRASDLLTPFLDDWGSTMRVPLAQRPQAYQDYLLWEQHLSKQLMTNDTVRFRWLSSPSAES